MSTATATLDQRLVEALQRAAQEVLVTMASLTPRALDEQPESTSLFRDEVIGLLGFTGGRSGTVVVRTTERMAKAIAARMLMVEPDEFGDFAEAADAFGEVVNMIAGSFKNAWVAAGHTMELSMPNVIHHGFVKLHSDGPGAVRSRIHVALDDGALDIGVHLEGAAQA
jgi:chemotaxis protein CheX